MSYIDTVNNSFVGTFCGIAVYHPLEPIGRDGSDEFKADPKNLVIGGGSGEHPGLVIKNLDVCVWDFLECSAKLCGKDATGSFFTEWMNQFSYEQIDAYNSTKNLTFTQWSMDRVSSFTKTVNSTFQTGVKYYKTRDKVLDLSTEEKISVMMGEFIYFAAPQLISPELRFYIDTHMSQLVQNDIDIHAPFQALNVPPKGYPNNSGRGIVADEERGSKVKWGLRFDEEHLLDPDLNDPNRDNNKPKPRF